MRIAVALCIAGAAPVAGRAADLQERVAAAPGGTLKVDLQRGSIEVEGHEPPFVTIDARSAGAARRSTDFELRSDGRDVLLKGDLGGFFAQVLGSARIRVRIRVPFEYDLDLKTQGGAIEVMDVRGRVKAESSGGPIQVDQVTGELDLKTSGGSITVTELRGSLRAETSGGPVRIFDVHGDVEAKTSGGPIIAHEVDGRVRAQTSGGPISARWIRAPAGELETSGGGIEVEFASEYGVDLQAETSGGRVQLSPDFTIRGRTEPDRVDAQLNGGGERLQLKTSGGGIRVQSN